MTGHIQFCRPTPWTVLAPPASGCTPDNPQRHLPIEAGAAFDQVLREINLLG